MATFVVKVRDTQTRSWGNETEVSAPSAKEAGEQVAGETLVAASGVRAHLRARVSETPFGSRPPLLFDAAIPVLP